MPSPHRKKLLRINEKPEKNMEEKDETDIER